MSQQSKVNSRKSKFESSAWSSADHQLLTTGYDLSARQRRSVILSRSEAKTENLAGARRCRRFFGLRSQNDRLTQIHAAEYSSGFTLLEVLVASAILSLVLAALYGVFSQTLAGKHLAEERAARARTARIVLLRISEDLQSALPPANNKMRFLGETHPTRELPEDALSFVTLTRTAHSSHVPEGDLSEITYLLEPDPTDITRKQLVRRVRATLSPRNNEVDEATPLLPDVHGLHFRFFNGREWLEEWRQEQVQMQLPRAVETTVYVADSRGEIAPYSTVTILPLADKRGGQLS